MTQTARILLVDDDPMILDLLAEVLSSTAVVTRAHDAADAIHMLDWEPYDLLILDLNLPAVNGDEALGLIRARPAGQSLPILIISGDPDLRNRVPGGVQGLLQKPFNTDTLLAEVRRLVPAAPPSGAPVAAPGTT